MVDSNEGDYRGGEKKKVKGTFERSRILYFVFRVFVFFLN